MTFNSDQALAFEHVLSGKNLFLTGPAGSGKSFLIQRIVEWGATVGKTIAVTAMTGCAALLLGHTAKTLHSWAGIGLGKDPVDVLCASILKHAKHKRKWKKTELLIVDEISMMTPELYEKLDTIGKRVRGSEKPWGGLQVILCGDFFQLPPVARGSAGISGELSVGRFAFESPAWAAGGLQPVVLTKIERQTDARFQTLLNECRVGRVSAESVDLLKSRQGLNWKKQLIKPTLLFSRNADVDMINEKNIQVTDEAVICPTLLRPHFPLTQYAGRVLDRDAVGAEMRRIEADQPTQFGNLMGLLNAGNYVMTERTAKYVPVLEPDVTVEMVGAVDVAYIQWLRLKQMERYQIHAVQDHEYIHTVHGGSTYLQTKEANEAFTETHMRPRLRAL